MAGAGPLAGVVAGLRAARHELVLIVAGDQPNLPPVLLRGLLEAAAPAPAAVLVDGDGWRPLPCVVRRAEALAAAERRLGTADASLRGWLDALEPLAVPEWRWKPWDPDGAWRADVDTPEDLARG